MKKLKLLFVFMIVVINTMYSQSYNWEQLTKSQYAFCQVVDANYLWTGTENGIVKRNLLTNECEFLNTSNTSLPFNTIKSAVIDQNNNKWFGTGAININDDYGNGLVKYNGTTWKIYNTSNSGLPNNTINALAVNNNKIWIATNKGLACYNGTSWQVFNTNNSQIPSNIIYSIAVESPYIIWIGTNKGITKYNGSTWTTYNTTNSGLPNNYVRAIAIENNGNKWIGTSGGGLALLSIYGWTIYNTNNSALPNNKVLSITIDKNNNKWIGTDDCEGNLGGLAKFNGTTWNVYNCINTSELNWATQFFSTVFENNGKMWVGHNTGLTSCINNNWKIENISITPLFSNYILSILAIDKNEQWIGINYGIVHHYGNNWIYNSLDSGFMTKSVYAIAKDANGAIWLGTNAGLIKFYNDTWTTYSSGNSGLVHDHINAITIDNNTLWISTDGGISTFNGNTWTSYTTANSNLPNNHVYSIAIENDLYHTKWIASSTKLVKLNGTSWTIWDNTNSILTGQVLSDIKIDKNGKKWIGITSWGVSSGCLIGFDGINNWEKYTSVGSSDVNMEFDVTCLEIDNNNALWIGLLNDGLLKFENQRWEWFTDKNSPITSNEVTCLSKIPDNISYPIPLQKRSEVFIGSSSRGITNVGYVYTSQDQSQKMLNSVEENFSQSKISIYPNPSNGLFTIRNLNISVKTYAEVSDLAGKILYNCIVDETGVINLSSFNKGFYILKITNDSNTEQIKICIK